MDVSPPELFRNCCQRLSETGGRAKTGAATARSGRGHATFFGKRFSGPDSYGLTTRAAARSGSASHELERAGGVGGERRQGRPAEPQRVAGRIRDHDVRPDWTAACELMSSAQSAADCPAVRPENIEALSWIWSFAPLAGSRQRRSTRSRPYRRRPRRMAGRLDGLVGVGGEAERVGPRLEPSTTTLPRIWSDCWRRATDCLRRRCRCSPTPDCAPRLNCDGGAPNRFSVPSARNAAVPVALPLV